MLRRERRGSPSLLFSGAQPPGNVQEDPGLRALSKKRSARMRLYYSIVIILIIIFIIITLIIIIITSTFITITKGGVSILSNATRPRLSSADGGGHENDGNSDFPGYRRAR
jgi:hypothetical protein